MFLCSQPTKTKKGGESMNLQIIGSVLGVWAGEHTACFKCEVSWSDYLAILDPCDRENVSDLCERLRRLSKERNLPLAVVAVDSVLNPTSGTGLGSYQNVDLLLVPLLNSDLRRFKGAVSRFIKKQPESERRNEGLGRVLRRSSWRRSLKAASTGLPARLQQLTYWYQISTFWNLAFPSGKPVQIFVQALEYRRTLSSMINAENASPDPQLFSRLVLAP